LFTFFTVFFTGTQTGLGPGREVKKDEVGLDAEGAMDDEAGLDAGGAIDNGVVLDLGREAKKDGAGLDVGGAMDDEAGNTEAVAARAG
jgi:hypothetical protein